MRLWTFHPKYLDVKGIVAVWREGLLAKKVFSGKTSGYKHHPQLIRFRRSGRPLSAINQYLREIYVESEKKGYNFNLKKAGTYRTKTIIPVSDGQLIYEWQHFLQKIKKRNPPLYKRYRNIISPDPHPLFQIIPGEIEEWERVIL